ncbi:helix-turn-helix transcriptional regulator [Burkholderia plantarii]|uniref:helix-turn-helix transcriptional regulator n=1 Tax=Burkholderia plantarii TaxID=41899 RepID=UPI0009BAA308
MDRNNIKQIRRWLDLSQAAFASAIGVTQGCVSHYECGRQDVSPNVARRIIALASGRGVAVTFDDIYGRSTSAHECIVGLDR